MGFDPKDIHKMEQASQAMREQFVPVLYSFFEGAMKVGFSREEAFELTQSYLTLIFSQGK